MQIFSSKKRVAAIGAVTALTLAGGGMAVAYWTSSGTGSGSAATSSGAPSLAITQTSTLTEMFPGDAAQDLVVNVQNTGSNAAYVASLGAYITTNKAGCDGTDFLINGSSTGILASPTALAWTAGELDVLGEADSTGNTLQFNNKGTVQDACKGAAVTVHYVAK
jgi:hypothetical protein